jgi:hypothetical protein
MYYAFVIWVPYFLYKPKIPHFCIWTGEICLMTSWGGLRWQVVNASRRILTMDENPPEVIFDVIKVEITQDAYFSPKIIFAF